MLQKKLTLNQFSRSKDRDVKKKFSYEVTGSSEEVFERDVFFPLVDSVMISLRERMEQLQKHHSLWGFLYNMNKLPEKEELKKRCIHLSSTRFSNSW